MGKRKSTYSISGFNMFEHPKLKSSIFNSYKGRYKKHITKIAKETIKIAKTYNKTRKVVISIPTLFNYVKNALRKLIYG